MVQAALGVSPGACERGNSRREELGAIHQGTVVVVADEVPVLACDIAVLRPEEGLNLHWVLGVVEVDDMDVKYKDS